MGGSTFISKDSKGIDLDRPKVVPRRWRRYAQGTGFPDVRDRPAEVECATNLDGCGAVDGKHPGNSSLRSGGVVSCSSKPCELEPISSIGLVH